MHCCSIPLIDRLLRYAPTAASSRIATALRQRAARPPPRPPPRAKSAAAALRRDPYATLGISPTATRAEAKEAYLRLAKPHPDGRRRDALRAIADAREIIETAKERPRRDAQTGGSRTPRRRAGSGKSERRAGRAVTSVYGSSARARSCWRSARRRRAPSRRRRRAAARDETLVEGCWVNPATGRLEPPAPWDDAYRAARAAGRTRAAPRHAVGERN